jgi:hypothetical protein
MSVASVLEREGNVRDMTPVLREESPVWDLSPEFVLSAFERSELYASIILPDISSYEEANKRGRELRFAHLYKTEYLPLFSRKNSGYERVRIEEYLDSRANAKLLLGNDDVSGPYKETGSKLPWDKVRGLIFDGIHKISKLDENAVLVNQVHFEALRFLLDVKIMDPSLNVEQAARNLAKIKSKKVDLSIEDAHDINSIDVAVKMLVIAPLKILVPDFYKGIDVAGSPLYKAGLKYLKSESDPSIALYLAAGLKVLDAQEISINDEGFHFTFKNEGPRVPLSPSIPEIRRFDS